MATLTSPHPAPPADKTATGTTASNKPAPHPTAAAMASDDPAYDDVHRAAVHLRYRKQQYLACAVAVEKAEAALEQAERNHADAELQLHRARLIVDRRLDAVDVRRVRA